MRPGAARRPEEPDSACARQADSPGILPAMLLMAVSGAAVLALVCWAALREAERPPGPSTARGDTTGHGGAPPANRDGARADGQRQGAGSALQIGGLVDATVADADNDEALAAAAALWSVLARQRD